MKSTVKYIALLTIGVVIYCCAPRNEDPNAGATNVYNEAMKIHDEVMPLMDEMYRLEQQLKARQDSLLADSIGNGQKIILVREKLSNLQKSGKAMMDWMHNIQDVHEGDKVEMDSKEILETQQGQKKKIEQVREAMVNSVSEAREILINK